MPEYGPSISERWNKICEEVTMAAGDGGFTGRADASGPVAGYDPVMGDGILNRTLKKIKRKEKELIKINSSDAIT